MKSPLKSKVKSTFSQSLKDCRNTAKEAFNSTNTFTLEVEDILDNLYNKLNDISNELFLDEDTKSFSFSGQLKSVIKQFNNHSQNGLNELKQSSELKKDHLKDFTLTFFGRTKAGKSTIRESITKKGDGSTIGLGTLHTTKEVKEYKWQGLRLLDTPGVEGFKGEQEIEKAHEVIDQSDMLVFLTTDESTQPDEFKEMSGLIEINKPFFILLNVKDKLTNPDFLKRFLFKNANLFNKERINEHCIRISKETKKIGIDNIDIIYISALAACISQFTIRGLTAKNKKRFLNSIKHPELKTITEWTINNITVSKAELLWELSQMEFVHKKIVKEINKRGKHRRVLTFYDSIINYVDTISIFLYESQCSMRSQALYMIEKRKILHKFFDNFITDSKQRIEGKCSELFNDMIKWVPSFVDEYLGEDNAEKVFKKTMNKSINNIEEQMSLLSLEIIDELKANLTEFHQEYQYDIKKISNADSNISNYKEGQIGKILKWSGVGTGALSAGAFALIALKIGVAEFWNPVGWIALGVSVISGIFSWIFGNNEEKEWKKTKKQAIMNISYDFEVMKKRAIKMYFNWFEENIVKKGKHEMISKVSNYTNELFKVIDLIKDCNLNLIRIYNALNREMFTKLFNLEGINILDKDIKAIAREQGYASKIVVSENIKIDDNIIMSLNKVCGENIVVINDSENIKQKISKAFYPAKPLIENIMIAKENGQSFAKISVMKNDIPIYFGKRHTNLRLTQKVCDMKIKLIY